MKQHKGPFVHTGIAACPGGHVHLQFGRMTNIVLSAESFLDFARSVVEAARGFEEWAERQEQNGRASVN